MNVYLRLIHEGRGKKGTDLYTILLFCNLHHDIVDALTLMLEKEQREH